MGMKRRLRQTWRRPTPTADEELSAENAMLRGALLRAVMYLRTVDKPEIADFCERVMGHKRGDG